MGRLTTHVLDTAAGKPAEGLTIELWALDGEPSLIKTVLTNADGRVDGGPILDAEALRKGTYELVFHAVAYLRFHGHKLSDPPFLDIVPIRFGVGDPQAHYHVPLLISAFGYSTYRGS